MVAMPLAWIMTIGLYNALINYYTSAMKHASMIMLSTTFFY